LPTMEEARDAYLRSLDWAGFIVGDQLWTSSPGLAVDQQVVFDASGNGHQSLSRSVTRTYEVRCVAD